MWSVWPAASSHSHNESTLALSSDTIQHAPPHKANTKTQTQTQTHKQRHRHIWTPTQTRTHRYRHTCIQQHTHINLVAADYSYIEGSNVLKQFNGFQRKYFPSPILIEMWCRQVSPVKLKIAWPPLSCRSVLRPRAPIVKCTGHQILTLSNTFSPNSVHCIRAYFCSWYRDPGLVIKGNSYSMKK